MIQIGPHQLTSAVLLAPMAGVTDLAFRRLAVRCGAGLATSEMVSARQDLRDTELSRERRLRSSDLVPHSVQIAGADPAMMAEFARISVADGAEIVDINMGCPAKKVCRQAAGSALLRDEPLVGRILEAVTGAVDVPVTLKIRTGWDTTERNAIQIAHIARETGIQLLAIHGRTRACRFRGEAEYDTIAEVRTTTDLPIVANGDIDSVEKACAVIAHTGVAGVMIGRAAMERPWLLAQIAAALEGREIPTDPSSLSVVELLDDLLTDLHALHGEPRGVRIARKFAAAFLARLPQGNIIRGLFNQAPTAAAQFDVLQRARAAVNETSNTMEAAA